MVRYFRTPASLLFRLRAPEDTVAWNRFVELYSPLLYHWAKALGCQESDCEDLVQDVFVILWRRLPEFEYDANRSFHAWLKTVFLNRYRSKIRDRAFKSVNVAAVECIDAVMHQMADEDEKVFLIRQAFRLIEQEYSELHQRVFRAYVMEDRPAQEVATEFGIQLGTIYGIKSKVLSHLRQRLVHIFE